jgi:L-ascorbate metabolism protein UlaG (beta-lactamase superfamily)
VVPAIHSALGNKHYHDTRRYNQDTKLKVPLRIDQFIEGGALSFLARFENHTVLTMGSMNFIEREMAGLDPDILLAGINGSRFGLYKYDERLINSTGKPSVIIPTHWDSFNLPYSFSQEENVKNKLIPFQESAARLAPNSRVIIPTHLKTFFVE